MQLKGVCAVVAVAALSSAFAERITLKTDYASCVVETRGDGPASADVVIAHTGSAVEQAAIAAGKRVLSVANENGAPDGRVGYLRTSAPKVKVACIGDSITYGWHLKDRANDAYPAQLQRLLDVKAPGRCAVRNFGNPGRGVYTHTKFGGTCRAFSAMREHAEALAWEPDIVICNLGANDWEEFPKEAEGALEKGLFRKEYKALLEQYRALGSRPQIWIWTRLAPLTKAHPEYGKPSVAALDAELAVLARETGVGTIDMLTPLEEGLEKNIMADDGIHPTVAGCRRIAAETYKCVFGEMEK